MNSLKRFSPDFLLLCLAIQLHSFGQVNKKAEKELNSIFQAEYITEPIKLSEQQKSGLPLKILDNTFFKVKNNGQLIGYAYIGTAPSKDNVFDYLVVFDKDLIISKIKVLTYRENYGGEISSKRWLMQFKGKSKGDKLLYEKDIIAISGATISANSLTTSINKLLNSIAILEQQNVFK